MKTYKKKFTLTPFNPESKIQITCELCITDLTLKANFIMAGDISLIDFAKDSKGIKRKNKLWESTCFELFLKNPKSPAYYEVNVSSSGDWNVFEFTDYRKNKKETDPVSAPMSRIKSTAGNFNIEFEVKLDEFKNIFTTEQSALLGISCVLKQANGEYIYYALRHKKEKPDFHLASNYETISFTHT